jgi:hypothetical protein
MDQFKNIVSQMLVSGTAGAARLTECPGLVRPTSDEECAALREWAENTPVAVQPPATNDQIAKHLAFMASALPAKGVDDLTSQMRFAVYTSLLGGTSNKALAHMARRACETLDWFPTPRQCLDLIAEYRPLEPDQDVALRLCQDYTTEQFEGWITNVIDGQPIGDVPEQWMRIAVEQGAMRRLGDGRYVSRAQYYGPNRPYAEVA